MYIMYRTAAQLDFTLKYSSFCFLSSLHSVTIKYIVYIIMAISEINTVIPKLSLHRSIFSNFRSNFG